MSYTGLKAAAFSLGALAMCLSASAETPGLEHIGCCGVGAWAVAAPPPAPTPSSYIERSRAKGDWRIHVAGVASPPVALPPAIDHALQHALGQSAPPPPPHVYGADTGYDETITRWYFTTLVYDGGYQEYVRRHKCHDEHDQQEPWCRHKPPPPPPHIPAVPEPGLWALMISGVAVMGAALRWRRRSAAGAAPTG